MVVLLPEQSCDPTDESNQSSATVNDRCFRLQGLSQFSFKVSIKLLDTQSK